MQIGVNSAGMVDLAFWARLTAALGARLTRELDYVGLDMFPDVFRPAPHDRLAAAVTFVLDRFCDVTLQAGIPADTPVHITETGWPTGTERTEAEQATVLTQVAEGGIHRAARPHPAPPSPIRGRGSARPRRLRSLHH